MSRANEVCLILHPSVTRADFEKAARDSGFVHFATHPRGGDQRAYEQVWLTPNVVAPTEDVHYIEDSIPNFPYLVVGGVDPSRLAARLAERISVYTPDELLNSALDASTHNDQVRAINRLAIGFVNFDPTAYTIIMTFALQAQNPVLREAAVNAIAFRAWPHFRPLLERIVAEDPAENVRRKAALLLAHWPTQAQETT
jgi:hypothetical protein